MSEVKTSGPFFTLGAKPVQDALDKAVKDTLQDTASIVKEQLTPGHGVVSGAYRDSIHGDLQTSRNGVVRDSGQVYGPWLEGVSSRNQRSRFKGYAMFRNALQRGQAKADDSLQNRVAAAVKELS